MPKKVLIVDDSMVARMSVKNCMPRDMDIEVIEAKNGSDGLEKFTEHVPDITFLDLTMPVMNGFEALEKMKQLRPSAPVIVLTADVQKKTTEKVVSLGADRTLKKPPLKDDVVAILREYLQS